MVYASDSDSRIYSPEPTTTLSLDPTPEIASPSPLDLSPLLDELSELRAVVGDVSSTILSRLGAFYNENYTGSLSCPDYLIWRDSQYVYYMVVLTGASYSNGSIQGEFDLVTYDSYSVGSSLPSVSVQSLSDRSFAIPKPGQSGSAYVYSSLPGYLPASSIDAKPALSLSLTIACSIALAGSLIYLWLRGLFRAKD